MVRLLHAGNHTLLLAWIPAPHDDAVQADVVATEVEVVVLDGGAPVDPREHGRTAVIRSELGRGGQAARNQAHSCGGR
jgi:hypothetical protein